MLVGMVPDNILDNPWKMIKSVKKVRGPVEVCWGVGDGITQAAHGLERTADFVRERTDDGLGRCIFAAPVASPT
jgi:hypothetical protein